MKTSENKTKEWYDGVHSDETSGLWRLSESGESLLDSAEFCLGMLVDVDIVCE